MNTNSQDRDPFEDQLRQALAEEAARVRPSDMRAELNRRIIEPAGERVWVRRLAPVGVAASLVAIAAVIWSTNGPVSTSPASHPTPATATPSPARVVTLGPDGSPDPVAVGPDGRPMTVGADGRMVVTMSTVPAAVGPDGTPTPACIMLSWAPAAVGDDGAKYSRAKELQIAAARSAAAAKADAAKAGGAKLDPARAKELAAKNDAERAAAAEAAKAEAQAELARADAAKAAMSKEQLAKAEMAKKEMAEEQLARAEAQKGAMAKEQLAKADAAKAASGKPAAVSPADTPLTIESDGPVSIGAGCTTTPATALQWTLDRDGVQITSGRLTSDPKTGAYSISLGVLDAGSYRMDVWSGAGRDGMAYSAGQDFEVPMRAGSTYPAPPRSAEPTPAMTVRPSDSAGATYPATVPAPPSASDPTGPAASMTPSQPMTTAPMTTAPVWTTSPPPPTPGPTG